MPLPRVIARFNRRVTNPIQRRWADRLPGYGLLEHTGRRSGRKYRTPLSVFRAGDGFAIVLVYGTRSDWLRNVQDSGGAVLVHRRRQYTLSSPRLVSGSQGRAHLPFPGRVLSRVTRSSDVLLVIASRSE